MTLSYFNKTENIKGGFTLVELLVVIAIIGLLTTVVLVTTVGTRKQAYETRGLQNQANAKGYCAANPGVSTLNGDTVYCDEKYVMWTTTLAGTFTWGPETDLPEYANGDCNNLTDEDIVNYPACNACATLSYAGFSEGWRLPSQGVIPPGQQYCNEACGRDGSFCAPNRQLWDFGAENCSWSPAKCTVSNPQCAPTWDPFAVATYYWSSTQSSTAEAWRVDFFYGGNNTSSKSTARRIRCYLGQYW